MADLRARVPRELAAVAAIGLSGQMHGAVLLDAAGRVLRPAILWNDGRSSAECAELGAARAGARGASPAISPCPASPRPSCCGWQRTSPRSSAPPPRCCCRRTTCAAALTGDDVSEMSDASGTPLARCRPARLVGRHAGGDRPRAPRTCRAWSRAASPPARCCRHSARAWGLGDGVIVAGGGGDNAATRGRHRRGPRWAGIPIARHLRRAVRRHGRLPPQPGPGRPRLLPRAAGPVAPDGRACCRPPAACAGSTKLTGAADEAALLAEVETLSLETRLRAPLFLPYLSGERTPHNDPACPGRLVRPRPRHRPRRARLRRARRRRLRPRRRLSGAAGRRHATSRARRSSAAAPAAACGPNSSPARSACRSTATRAAKSAPPSVPRAWPCWPPIRRARIEDICTQPPLLDRIEPAPWSADLAPRFERFRQLYQTAAPALSHGVGGEEDSRRGDRQVARLSVAP